MSVTRSFNIFTFQTCFTTFRSDFGYLRCSDRLGIPTNRCVNFNYITITSPISTTPASDFSVAPSKFPATRSSKDSHIPKYNHFTCFSIKQSVIFRSFSIANKCCWSSTRVNVIQTSYFVSSSSCKIHLSKIVPSNTEYLYLIETEYVLYLLFTP